MCFRVHPSTGPEIEKESTTDRADCNMHTEWSRVSEGIWDTKATMGTCCLGKLESTKVPLVLAVWRDLLLNNAHTDSSDSDNELSSEHYMSHYETTEWYKEGICNCSPTDKA